MCALLHVELVVPNSFIAQTGDVTTGIIVLKRGEAHRRLKLVNSAGTRDAAAASQSAQHRKQCANSAEPHGPPATESEGHPEGHPEGPVTSIGISTSWSVSPERSLASVKLDTSPRSSTVPARIDLFALPSKDGLGLGSTPASTPARMDSFTLPLSFTPIPTKALTSLEKELELENEIELFGDRCPYSPGGTLAPPQRPGALGTALSTDPWRRSKVAWRTGAKTTEDEMDRMSDASSGDGSEASSTRSPSISSSAPSIKVVRDQRSAGMTFLRRAMSNPSNPRKATPDVMADALANTILLETIYEGGSIGADEFLLGVTHRYDIIAVQMCECLRLRRKPFNELLSRFAELGPTLKANAHQAIHANSQRDEAVMRKLTKSPKNKNKGPGIEDDCGAGVLAGVLGEDTASIAAVETLGQEKALVPRQHQSHLILDAATKRLGSSHAWSLLLFILLLYRLCGDTFRASLREHFALPIEWSEALQLTPALYRDRLEANEAWGYQPWPLFPQPNGVPTVHSPWGVKSCDPSAPSAQQYYDSVGLCVFDFLADLAIGVDLLVVQLRTGGARAAGTGGVTDEPTTARLTARNVLPFASLFLAAVFVLDLLSIAVAGVRSGGDAVSDAAAQTASIVWVVRLPLLVLLPRHLYSLEAWLLERSPSTDIQHMRLGRMLLAVFVTSHLAGCAWAIIGLRDFQATFVSNTSEHTWSAYSWWATDPIVIEGAATCQPLAVLAWLRGFYIAFGTSLFVVIGDVAPTTMNETYIMIFVILVVGTVISAIQGTVVSVVSLIGNEEHEEECVLANTKKVMVSHPGQLRLP